MAFDFFTVLRSARDLSQVADTLVLPRIPSSELVSSMNDTQLTLDAGSDFFDAVRIGDVLAIENELVTVTEKTSSPIVDISRSTSGTTASNHSAGVTVDSTAAGDYAEGRLFQQAIDRLGREIPRQSVIEVSSNGTGFYDLSALSVTPTWSFDTHAIRRIRLSTDSRVRNWIDRNDWHEDIDIVSGSQTAVLRFHGGDPGDTFQIFHILPWLKSPTTFNVPEFLHPALTNITAARFARAAAGHHARKSERKLRSQDPVSYQSITSRYLSLAKSLEEEYEKFRSGLQKGKAVRVDLDTGYGGTGRQARGRVILRQRRY